VPATAYIYERRISTACGPATAGIVGPFYCTLDSGLYLDLDFIQQVRDAAGEFPVGYVVAHEVGHRVQELRGISKIVSYILFGQTFSRDIELQADCLAGVWAHSAADRSLATPGDVTRAVIVAWALGDSAGTSGRSANAHGSPAERAAVFTNGYLDGDPVTACGLS
jgi:predicted metalloprotease